MKKIVALFVITLVGKFALGQDVHFSQMPFSPLNLNPALAGANFDMQGIVNYKTQWKNIADPYNTMGASFDMRINKGKTKKGFLATGINFFYDKAGNLNMNTTNAAISLAYHLFLNQRSTLGAALYGGIAQKSISPAAGQWASQYNGSTYDRSLLSGETFNSQIFIFSDFGTGIVYTYQKNERYMAGNDQLKIKAGLAFFHINKPRYSYLDQGNERLHVRTSAFVNGLIGIGNSPISVVPGIYFNQQGSAQEILAGSYIQYKLKEESKYTGFVKASAISAGVFYRAKDAVIIKGLLEWSNYAMGIAYDITTSTLTEASIGRGGFELMLRFVSPSPFSGSKSRI